MNTLDMFTLGVSLYWGLLGTIVGSFLGVIIDRLPKNESILWGRSHCDFCKKSLRWFELVPIFSFLFLRGRCLRCKKKLSWRYPLYEIVSGILFASLWWIANGSLLPFVCLLVVATSLFVIVVIDLDHMIIPDVLVATSAIGAFFYYLVTNHTISEIVKNNLLTGIVTTILFYLLWLGTKRRGIGFGDVKLVFALGILAGFPRIIISLYAAFLTGAFIAIILLLRGKKTMKSAVPFGPFLILGTVFSFVVNTQTVLSYFL